MTQFELGVFLVDHEQATFAAHKLAVGVTQL